MSVRPDIAAIRRQARSVYGVARAGALAHTPALCDYTEALETGLRRYGNHDYGCAVDRFADNPAAFDRVRPACTCGLDGLLDEIVAGGASPDASAQGGVTQPPATLAREDET